MRIKASKTIFIAVLMLLTIPAAQAKSPGEWLVDVALQECISDLAQQHGWQEPAAFTQIKCNSMGIQSLKGLENFVNVTELSIYNNELSEIDTDLSQLTALNSLNLARNKLQTVTIARMRLLEQVYLFGNNIETLSLTDLPKLTLIKAHNNKATSFNYSNLPKLEKIYVFNNQMETFDIDHLPALVYMDCRQNPMPDELYDRMDQVSGVTYLHDGNADDW